ncbi:hypothetical protein [Bacillus sp. B-jedd]|uniref:hypothetical protein n=1 Tax=Bacillus sp. B-jedd TaxID=1476857 RepID=UPI0005155DF3|nr:hypothetical protein [Bacillus sp. B-jedd]CEG29792.1 hypothetical protein BN1002_04753 [Bacillus sp. B-jedd]
MYEKSGTVVSVNTNSITARVMFEDLDGLISDELRVVGIGWMPKVGDEVFCSFTQEKKGFIIGPIAGGD